MTTKVIRDEIVHTNIAGIGPIVAVVPVIPDNAPSRIREGIARRRIATLTGSCPCGASVDYGAGEAGSAKVAAVLHEVDCPADTDRLVKAVRRWQR